MKANGTDKYGFSQSELTPAFSDIRTSDQLH
jgi:hypothetical protein